MLVVIVYETSQKMFILRTKVGLKDVPHDFTCNIICDFARDGRRPHEFRFVLKKKIALNLERGVWHFLVIV